MTAGVLAQLLLSGLLLGGVYALVALGLTLVFGVLGLINFAHGDYLMLAMMAAYGLFAAYHVDPYVSITVVAPSLFVLGLVTYQLLIRPTLEASHAVQVFVTFGLSIAVENLVFLLAGGNERSVTPSYAYSAIALGPVRVGVPQLVAFTVAILSTLALFWFLNRSRTGRAIRATGQNLVAAQLVGINVDRARLITFGIGTGLVGVAGPLMVPIYAVYPTFGADFILVAFLVVVLGGLGSLRGALVGGLLIGMVQTLSRYYVSSSLSEAVYFLFFIVILAVRPAGLFGARRESTGRQ